MGKISAAQHNLQVCILISAPKTLPKQDQLAIS